MQMNISYEKYQKKWFLQFVVGTKNCNKGQNFKMRDEIKSKISYLNSKCKAFAYCQLSIIN